MTQLLKIHEIQWKEIRVMSQNSGFPVRPGESRPSLLHTEHLKNREGQTESPPSSIE